MSGPIRVGIRRKPGCEDVPVPRYMSVRAAGMDICAACDGDLVLAPGEIQVVPCGFYVAVPAGYEAQVRPRSGLAARYGIIVPNAPGTIDADFRGEVCVILGNIGATAFVVKRGMRIAQMVVAAVARAELDVTEDLDDTDRGEGGFGHTGL